MQPRLSASSPLQTQQKQHHANCLLSVSGFAGNFRATGISDSQRMRAQHGQAHRGTLKTDITNSGPFVPPARMANSRAAIGCMSFRYREPSCRWPIDPCPSMEYFPLLISRFSTSSSLFPPIASDYRGFDRNMHTIKPISPSSTMFRSWV